MVESRDVETTAADGSFQFTDLPARTYTVVAQAPTFGDVASMVRVDAGQVASIRFVLSKLPEFRPYNTTVVLKGHYDCAAVALIIPGSCGILIENVTCATHVECGDPFSSSYAVNFTVQPAWQTVVVALRWSAGTPGLGGMRVYVQDGSASAKAGHGVTYAKQSTTTSELLLRLARGVADPSADPTKDGKARVPDAGGPVLLKVFPDGMGSGAYCSDSIGGCELGVGAALDVQFTAYVTTFYNVAGPAGYSFPPGS